MDRVRKGDIEGQCATTAEGKVEGRHKSWSNGRVGDYGRVDRGGGRIVEKLMEVGYSNIAEFNGTLDWRRLELVLTRR
jgi:hypothetical protein